MMFEKEGEKRRAGRKKKTMETWQKHEDPGDRQGETRPPDRL